MSREPDERQIWKHHKTGKLYTVACVAQRESDGELQVVYGNTQVKYVRPLTEFMSKFSFEMLVKDKQARNPVVDPISLGKLIEILERQHKDNVVIFDFCRFSPTTLDSYRGYYEQLAVGFTNEKETTCGDFLKECRDALGKTFEGYKGGSFVMDAETNVWVADHGNCYSTAIVGAVEESHQTTLTTAYID